VKSEAIIEVLQAQITRLDKLAGEEIAGFIVIPPEGQAVISISIESVADEISFYKNMADKLSLLKDKTNQFGGVVMPRGMR